MYEQYSITVMFLSYLQKGNTSEPQGWLVILLIVYASVCDVATEQMSRPGGLTDVQKADESTQKIADEVTHSIINSYMCQY